MHISILNDPPEKRKLKSYLADAIRLARVDGEFDEKEKEFIYKLAGNYSITDGEVDEILLFDIKYEFIPPTDIVERFKVLYDFMGVVLADGKMEEKEIRLCGALAIGLGYDPEIIHSLIEKIIVSMNNNMDPDKIYNDVEVKYRHPHLDL